MAQRQQPFAFCQLADDLIRRVTPALHYDDFRKGLRFLIIVVAAIGTAAALFLGPQTLDLVYGADLSGRTIAMLALSSDIYMLALAMSQVVLALEDHAQVAIGWISGILAFLPGIWLSSNQLFRRIEIGLVDSSVVARARFSIALKRRLSAITVAIP